MWNTSFVSIGNFQTRSQAFVHGDVLFARLAQLLVIFPLLFLHLQHPVNKKTKKKKRKRKKKKKETSCHFPASFPPPTVHNTQKTRRN
jgi:hypothetical protein